MSTDMNVETYLKWIRRNLHGIERDSIDQIVEELEGHINEKAADMAEAKGLKKPDEAIYQQVLEELGPPEEVAIDYLKILPKKPSLGLRAFLGLQLVIGLIGFLVGINEAILAGQDFADSGQWGPYIASAMLASLVFLFVGLGTMVLVMMQFKRPGLMVHYHSGSVLLALTLAAGLLFVMLGYLVSRYNISNMNYSQVTAIAMPIFLVLVGTCIFGLRASEEFLRRISLEEIDNKLFEKKRTASRNAMIAIVAVSMILVSGAGGALFSYSKAMPKETDLVSTDHIGGKYNAEIQHWKTYNPDDNKWYGDDKVVYTVNGTQHQGTVPPDMHGALDWLKNNTADNATVMCWWDYGHSIRGLAERNTVIANPSENMKASIADPSSIKEWDDQATVAKVAQAFTADNVSTTISIMKGTGAQYLLSDSRDATGISYAFFTATGLNPSDYFQYEQQNNPYIEPPAPEPTALGRQTTLYKIWLGQDLPGLNLVYSDLNVRIYKIA